MGMPISEPALSPPGAAYDAALAAFSARHVTASGLAGAVQAFHAVRNLPYFSGADRTPLAALQSGRGACTAKHIVLRDVLRRLGLPADVELVDCDFAAGVPAHDTMPPDLRTTATSGGIRDFHCWVRLNGANPMLLDATWPDGLVAYDFPVNADWTGVCDTRPAAPGGVVREVAEDVIAAKERLLAELSQAETGARRVFLEQLSAWLDDTQIGRGGPK